MADIRYFISPAYELRLEPMKTLQGAPGAKFSGPKIYDERDSLRNFIDNETIALRPKDLATRLTGLYFGDAGKGVLCEITEETCEPKHKEGTYYRMFKLKIVPSTGFIPSNLANIFANHNYKEIPGDEKINDKNVNEYF